MLTALFTKESLVIRLVKNADLQLNKRTKESLSCDLLKLLIYSGKSVQIISNKATNGRPYGLSVIYCCRLQPTNYLQNNV